MRFYYTEVFYSPNMFNTNILAKTTFKVPWHFQLILYSNLCSSKYCLAQFTCILRNFYIQISSACYLSPVVFAVSTVEVSAVAGSAVSAIAGSAVLTPVVPASEFVTWSSLSPGTLVLSTSVQLSLCSVRILFVSSVLQSLQFCNTTLHSPSLTCWVAPSAKRYRKSWYLLWS